MSQNCPGLLRWSQTLLQGNTPPLMKFSGDEKGDDGDTLSWLAGAIWDIYMVPNLAGWNNNVKSAIRLIGPSVSFLYALRRYKWTLSQTPSEERRVRERVCSGSPASWSESLYPGTVRKSSNWSQGEICTNLPIICFRIAARTYSKGSRNWWWIWTPAGKSHIWRG